jgi:hypothetical protein
MIDNQLKKGSLVEATAYKGELLKRRVVEIRGETIYICREEEWVKATQEGREPEAVGFKRQSVRSLPQ